MSFDDIPLPVTFADWKRYRLTDQRIAAGLSVFAQRVSGVSPLRADYPLTDAMLGKITRQYIDWSLKPHPELAARLLV